jgi:molybdopterin-guanine dinucleotide biosynthesis protein A
VKDSILVGIFVGGQSRRMGGQAKGLLTAPDSGEPLVVRLERVVKSAYAGSEVALVGRHAAYRHIELPVIEDNPPNTGPLGGLIALLEYAVQKDVKAAVALACDLPSVTRGLFIKLMAHAPDAVAVAPFDGHRYQPFFARYEPVATLRAARLVHAAGERSLQRVFERLGNRVATVHLTKQEQALLGDWDAASDIPG